MIEGERIKITSANVSIAWAVDYGEWGYGLALSSDKTFLTAGAVISSVLHLAKLCSNDGGVLASFYIEISAHYDYILASD